MYEENDESTGEEETEAGKEELDAVLVYSTQKRYV